MDKEKLIKINEAFLKFLKRIMIGKVAIISFWILMIILIFIFWGIR